MHPVLFWFAYTVAGVWLQYLLPGADVFAPALVVCLQERRLRQFAWLLPCWIILMEGSGNMPFGSMILRYAALVAVFVAGRWLFESRNVVFVFIIGIVMGGWHFLLSQIMAGLQGLEVGERAADGRERAAGRALPPGLGPGLQPFQKQGARCRRSMSPKARLPR